MEARATAGASEPSEAEPSRALRAAGRDAAALAVLAAVCLAAVVAGARGPRVLGLNLGPGDGPYVSGFLPGYEVDERVATHWSTSDAAVELPLRIEGPAVLAYRAARPLPDRAPVEVALAGRAVDAFTALRVFQDRRADLGRLGPTPVRITFRVGGGTESLGLKLDDVAVELRPDARVSLCGTAQGRPLVLLVLVFAILRTAGFAARGAFLATAPLSLLLAAGLAIDPWLVHRLLTGLPESSTVAALAAVVVRAWRHGHRGAAAPDARGIAALVLATFLVRAAALNHPYFYHPDLTIHARLVDVVRKAGFDLLRDPPAYLWGTRAEPQAGNPEPPSESAAEPSSDPAAERSSNRAPDDRPRAQRTTSGLWRIRTGGAPQAMPYSLAFHVPFAVLGLEGDRLLTTLKLAGVALSVVPLALAWALAGRLGLPPLGAVLLAFVPTAFGELTIGALPALFGHVLDVGLLLWLASQLPRLSAPTVATMSALLVAAAQLSYVYSIVTSLVLLAVLAALGPFVVPGWAGRRSAAVAGIGLAGSLLAFAVYYRGFASAIAAVFTAIEQTAGRPAPHSLFSYGFQHTFWGWPFLAAALVGLGLLLRARPAPVLVAAWTIAYVLLVGLRLAAPQAMRFGHENLFAAPLIAFAAAAAMAALAGRGPGGVVAARALLVLLVVYGLYVQAAMLVEQFGRAR